MSYQDYLSSDHWRKLRKEIIVERKCCEICGSTYILNVHHKSYSNGSQREVLGKEPKGLLVLLCEDCHDLWHKLYGRVKLRQEKIKKIKNKIKTGSSRLDAFLSLKTKKRIIIQSHA